MSTLIDNLNEIYTTKLQIKEVIGTQSDVFSDYPAYIAAAIGTGGGIDWDEVAAYGYIVPAGTVTLSSNGTVDVSTYANAYVSVQGGGGVTPTGYTSITTNGQYNVSSYEYAYVSVASQSGTELSSIWGGDEYDDTVHIPFTDNGTSYSYSWMFTWDGLKQEWADVGRGQGFNLCCRVGNETQYDWDEDTQQTVLHNTYRGVQMHVAQGSLYFGDLLTNIPTLDAASGYIDIASDLGDGPFNNNLCWATPDNFTPAYAFAELEFTIDVPKNFYYNYGVGYYSIETDNVTTVNKPTVRLSWDYDDTTVPATSMSLLNNTDGTYTYLTSSGNNFTYTWNIDNNNTNISTDMGCSMVANGTEYGLALYEPNSIISENIPASGTDARPIGYINGSHAMYLEFADINNYYSSWSMALTLTVSKTWYNDLDEDRQGTAYWGWTFSGTPISQ